MAWVLGIVGFALLVGVVPAWWLGRRYRERWGTRQVDRGLGGTGPYRQGELSEPELRGVPRVVRAAAALGMTWGILTVLVMLPSGFFMLAGLSVSPLAAMVGAPGVGVLMFSGAALCPRLCTSGVELLRVEGYAPPLRGTAKWTAAHHAGALALMGVLTVIDPRLWVLLVVALPPSAIGLVHAALLWRAVDHMVEAQGPAGPA